MVSSAPSWQHPGQPPLPAGQGSLVCAPTAPTWAKALLQLAGTLDGVLGEQAAHRGVVQQEGSRHQRRHLQAN